MTEEKKPEGEPSDTPSSPEIPEGTSKENKEIMEEIKKDKGGKLEEKEETPPEEPPKKPEKAEEEPEPPEEGGTGEKPKRTPKLMPTFKHEIAKKKWEQKEKEQTEEIGNLQRQLKESKTSPEREKALKDFAEKYGWEENQVNDFLKLLPKGETLPADLKERLDKFEKAQEEVRQQTMFGEDYEKTVTPILDEEKVPKEKRAGLKKLINTLAFTTKYATYDLDEMYYSLKRKGELDEFIGKGKTPAESSGGATHGKPGEPEAEGIMDMPDEEFDKWEKDRAKKARSGLELRRGGKTVEKL